ncbi:MAG: DUF6364 family protein [Cytophagaceae bacterium]|jgi:hypothetical protein|nr:DUF6364 family protein [Cytophagaceae bacterium]
MDVKLTLKLDEDVIRKAKQFALNHDTSLSKLIENYLNKLTNDLQNEEHVTPIVKELTGIIEESSIQSYLQARLQRDKK